MSVAYRLIRTTHPFLPGRFVKLYTMSRGVYTFDMLADDITHHCSLTRADVAGCMKWGFFCPKVQISQFGYGDIATMHYLCSIMLRHRA